MKRIIRTRVFETNSSATHSLTLGTLALEQEHPNYKFSVISLKPQHFGYGDIVAPMPDTNHFPEMNEICGDCEHLLHEERYNSSWYKCQNPVYGKYEYDSLCQRYKDSRQKIVDRLAKEQTPDTRACALLTCIVCVCDKPAELIHKYFNNLFSICKEVDYRGIKMERTKNTIEFWENAIFHGNWADYDSRCWMETHQDIPNKKLIVNIATNATKLKRYLFGAGAYAGGDRAG